MQAAKQWKNTKFIDEVLAEVMPMYIAILKQAEGEEMGRGKTASKYKLDAQCTLLSSGQGGQDSGQVLLV